MPEAGTAAPDEAALRAGFVMELRRGGVRDRRVLAAMETVPRFPFVPADLREFAYADRVLPIPCGQLLDKPSLLGRVLDALALEERHRVLEIGAGSGWSTAVLARLAGEVVGLERYATLAEAAAQRAQALSAGRAIVIQGDGLARLPEGPWDRIIVHGAVAAIPNLWRGALQADGLLAAAVGPPAKAQELTIAGRRPGAVAERSLGGVRLVPIEPGLARAI